MSQSLLLSSAILPSSPDSLLPGGAVAGRAEPVPSVPADAPSFSNVLSGQINDLKKTPQPIEKNETNSTSPDIVKAALPPSSDGDVGVSTVSVPAPGAAGIARDDLSLLVGSGRNAVLPPAPEGGNTLPSDRQAAVAIALDDVGQPADTITLPAIPWGLVAPDSASRGPSRTTGAAEVLPSDPSSGLPSPTPGAGEEAMTPVASGSGPRVEVSPDGSLPATDVPRRQDPRSPPGAAQAVALPAVRDAEAMGIPGWLPDEPVEEARPVAHPRPAGDSPPDGAPSGMSASTGVAGIAAASMSSMPASTPPPSVGGAKEGAPDNAPRSVGEKPLPEAEPGVPLQQMSAARPMWSDQASMAGGAVVQGSPRSVEFRPSPASTEVTAATVATAVPVAPRDSAMTYAASGVTQVPVESRSAAVVPATAALQATTVPAAGAAALTTAQIAAIPAGQDPGASPVPAGVRTDGSASNTMERVVAGATEGQGVRPDAGLRAVDVSGIPRAVSPAVPDPDPAPAALAPATPSPRAATDAPSEPGNLLTARDQKSGEPSKARIAASASAVLRSADSVAAATGLVVGREALAEDTYSLRPALPAAPADTLQLRRPDPGVLPPLSAHSGTPVPPAPVAQATGAVSGAGIDADPFFKVAPADAAAAALSFPPEGATDSRAPAPVAPRLEPLAAASVPVPAPQAPTSGAPAQDASVSLRMLSAGDDADTATEDSLPSIGAAATRPHPADAGLGGQPASAPLSRGSDVTAPAPALPQAPGSLPILLGAATGRLGEELGHRILWLSGHNLRSAEIQLDPPELGPLQVQVHSHRDGASIQFTAHSAAARDAVESNLPRLRELLEGSGLNLLDVNVAQQQQRGARGEREAFESGNPSSRGRLASIGQAGEVSAPVRRSLGLVDDYA